MLVGLYEEPDKPGDALEYVVDYVLLNSCSWIRKHLGSVMGIDVEALKKENDDLKKQNAELTQKVDELTKKVSFISNRSLPLL